VRQEPVAAQRVAAAGLIARRGHERLPLDARVESRAAPREGAESRGVLARRPAAGESRHWERELRVALPAAPSRRGAGEYSASAAEA
jgi:hypothetical protein